MPLAEVLLCLLILGMAIGLFYAVETWTDIDVSEDHHIDEHEEI